MPATDSAHVWPNAARQQRLLPRGATAVGTIAAATGPWLPPGAAMARARVFPHHPPAQGLKPAVHSGPGQGPAPDPAASSAGVARPIAGTSAMPAWRGFPLPASGRDAPTAPRGLAQAPSAPGPGWPAAGTAPAAFGPAPPPPLSPPPQAARWPSGAPPAAGEHVFRATGGFLPPIVRPCRTDPSGADCGCSDFLLPFRCIR